MALLSKVLIVLVLAGSAVLVLWALIRVLRGGSAGGCGGCCSCQTDAADKSQPCGNGPADRPAADAGKPATPASRGDARK